MTGEALLTLGRPREAEAYGLKLLRLTEELQDVRGKGWGFFVLGAAASRRGDHAKAQDLLRMAVECTGPEGDDLYRLTAASRRAFDLLAQGSSEAALDLACTTADELSARKLRHPHRMNDGVLLSAAALALMRGRRLSPRASAAVTRARVLGWFTAWTLRLTMPLFCAGRAAWAVAHGDLERGRALFARAIAMATEHGLVGELLDIHVIAALVLPEHEARAHATHASALRTAASER